MFQHKQDGIVKCLAYTFMSKCMLKKGLKCNVSHGGIALIQNFAGKVP